MNRKEEKGAGKEKTRGEKGGEEIGGEDGCPSNVRSGSMPLLS